VLRIVGEDGPEGITHRRVAKVAGLPLASTTYWFKSKWELLAAALDLAADRDVERLNHQAANIAGDPPSAAAIADVVLGPVEGGPRESLIASYALWLEAARQPALRATVERWAVAYHTTLSTLLDRAGSDDPSADAELLVAAADGLLMYRLSGVSGSDLHSQLQRLVASLTSSSS
jgi:DNA-binding transcriptional regulator YbjK